MVDKARAQHHYQGMAAEAGDLPDPSTVIAILADAISGANSPEALPGYFNHLAEDEKLQRAVKLYSGASLGEVIPTDD